MSDFRDLVVAPAKVPEENKQFITQDVIDGVRTQFQYLRSQKGIMTEYWMPYQRALKWLEEDLEGTKLYDRRGNFVKKEKVFKKGESVFTKAFHESESGHFLVYKKVSDETKQEKQAWELENQMNISDKTRKHKESRNAEEIWFSTKGFKMFCASQGGKKSTAVLLYFLEVEEDYYRVLHSSQKDIEAERDAFKTQCDALKEAQDHGDTKLSMAQFLLEYDNPSEYVTAEDKHGNDQKDETGKPIRIAKKDTVLVQKARAAAKYYNEVRKSFENKYIEARDQTFVIEKKVRDAQKEIFMQKCEFESHNDPESHWSKASEILRQKYTTSCEVYLVQYEFAISLIKKSENKRQKVKELKNPDKDSDSDIDMELILLTPKPPKSWEAFGLSETDIKKHKLLADKRLKVLNDEQKKECAKYLQDGSSIEQIIAWNVLDYLKDLEITIRSEDQDVEPYEMASLVSMNLIDPNTTYYFAIQFFGKSARQWAKAEHEAVEKWQETETSRSKPKPVIKFEDTCRLSFVDSNHYNKSMEYMNTPVAVYKKLKIYAINTNDLLKIPDIVLCSEHEKEKQHKVMETVPEKEVLKYLTPKRPTIVADHLSERRASHNVHKKNTIIR
jgi:hypothetical protein